MGFLGRLFGRRERPELNAATAKIDEQVYLINYSEHYANVAHDLTPRHLAELFLFRAWTAQFGYRIFSQDATASERLVGETVNSSKYLGLGIFRHLHGFSVEDVLGADFITLIEDRWQGYDAAVEGVATRDHLPTVLIVAALTARLGVRDPLVTHGLSLLFLGQLELIKRTSLELGLRG